MGDRFQIGLSLLSLGLVVIAALLVIKATRNRPAIEHLPDFATVEEPERLDVWMYEKGEDYQLVLKPYHDSIERDEFNNRILSRRFGAPDDTYQFCLFLIANFSPTKDVDFPVSHFEFAVTDSGGRQASSRPAIQVVDASSERGDQFVADALGLRRGPYHVPSLRLARYLVAFPTQPRPSEWKSLELNLPGETVVFTRTAVRQSAISRFQRNPNRPLEPADSVELARKPEPSE